MLLRITFHEPLDQLNQYNFILIFLLRHKEGSYGDKKSKNSREIAKNNTYYLHCWIFQANYFLQIVNINSIHQTPSRHGKQRLNASLVLVLFNLCFRMTAL